MYELLLLMLFGLWIVHLINLLQMDPNYPSESCSLQKALLETLDPGEIQDLGSTLASQAQLLGSHAQQLYQISTALNKLI